MIKLNPKRAMSPIIIMFVLFLVLMVSATVVWWYYNAILGGATETAKAASLGVISRMAENMSHIGEVSLANGTVITFNGSVLYVYTVTCLDPDCNATYIP